MADLRFNIDWLATGAEPLLRDTSGHLSIHVDTACLTRHEDSFSKTVRDGVLVSAYPLAMWLAASWWRVNHEPSLGPGWCPPTAWRMAHEVAAADHGYVWPQISFVPDGESVTVWARQAGSRGQSVTYLCNLDEPQSVPARVFQRQVEEFIEAVIRRAEGTGNPSSDLAALWALVCEDRGDARVNAVRVLEAQLGFDPEESPTGLMDEALRLQGQTGPAALAELAPLIGNRPGGSTLQEIERLGKVPGLQGRPEVPRVGLAAPQAGAAPWQPGVEAARALRQRLHLPAGPVATHQLLEMLGLTIKQAESAQPAGKVKVGLLRPAPGGQIDFLLRKLYPPTSKRFEYARLAGELAMSGPPERGWLVETDVITATQKRQRAFAAAFLCPIDSLIEFLDDDFSETALEAAAQHFEVSERIVTYQLANNGYRFDQASSSAPYRLQA